jgi:hypothetical protein
MFLFQVAADTNMVRADSASVYSWMKWILEGMDTEHPVTTVFAGMPKINSANNWAGFHHEPGVPYPHTHANIVRAFCNMRYQDYPVVQQSVFDNFPEMLQVDIYPFRQVGTFYQDTASYTPALGDELSTWLLDHAETGMDSTFLPALWEDVDVHYFPQAFGAAGGDSMWAVDTIVGQDTTWITDYNSYLYRIPTPAEFQMLVNVALMHQAKGIFPYSFMSYSEGGFNSASLLDYDMVRWDAPFEEYCYLNRAQDSLTYVRPDYFPPFQEGFDPLYDGPGLPPGTSGQRARQDFLEWKFAPYGRLWNSLGQTLSDVAFIAPELAELSWWGNDGHPGIVQVTCNEYCENWALPECRIFQDDGENHQYLFYVNRCCRDSVHTFNVGFVFNPLYPPSDYALDHTRRFIIHQTDMDSQEFSFSDTLGPGEARLIELIDSSEDADLRITEPDVFSRHQGSLVDRHEFDYTAGDVIEIYGTVYNLGTEGAEDVEVVLTDLTMNTVLGRDTLDFDGLSLLPGYATDSGTASFSWTPDAGDIGIHLLQIEAERVGSEDRRDNAVSVPFLIGPRDYATEVRGDPWDMTEAASDPPDWKTNDIEAVAEQWSTSWTDSIGGMFEGAIDLSQGVPHKGDISLAIPPSSNDWIDADTYRMLSFAGLWYNPYVSSGTGCPIYISWKDSHGTMHGPFNFSSYFGQTLLSGWNQWRVVGPCDLYELDPQNHSWTGSIQELWIRFQTGEPGSTPNDKAYIRLGWVRLEELAD